MNTSCAPRPSYTARDGVLPSTEGPRHNVLKIKPPLVPAPDEADPAVEVLDRILAEDFRPME